MRLANSPRFYFPTYEFTGEPDGRIREVEEWLNYLREQNVKPTRLWLEPGEFARLLSAQLSIPSAEVEQKFFLKDGPAPPAGPMDAGEILYSYQSGEFEFPVYRSPELRSGCASFDTEPA